jgi:hypothetical protein
MSTDEKLEAAKRRCIARILAVNDRGEDQANRLAMRAIVMASVNSFASEVKDAIDDLKAGEIS